VDVDVDLIDWVGVGLGGTYGCMCGILYAPMLGVVFYTGLVSLTSSSYPFSCSPYSSELILLTYSTKHVTYYCGTSILTRLNKSFYIPYY